MPKSIEKRDYRQVEAKIEESEEDLAAMYASMILRNKRFKPSYPLREQISAPEESQDQNGLELADLSDKELKSDSHLDEFAVENEAQKLLNNSEQSHEANL